MSLREQQHPNVHVCVYLLRSYDTYAQVKPCTVWRFQHLWADMQGNNVMCNIRLKLSQVCTRALKGNMNFETTKIATHQE